MQTGRRYRFYPSQDQAQTFAQWIGCVRAVYNGKDTEEQYLEWLRRWAKFSARAFPVDEGESEFTFDQAYSHLKPAEETHPWFYEVPSQLYRNAMHQRSQAWQKYWKDPQTVGKPGRRVKGENDSILLTKELFEFWGSGLILVGTPQNFVGVLEYKEHQSITDAPNSLTISRDTCNRWWISFNFEDGVAVKTDEEILKELSHLTNKELAATTAGHDRGIVQQVTGSDGKVYGYTEQKQQRFAKHRRRVRALQKKMARQKDKKSKRRAKTKLKLAKTHAHIQDLRVDHAHQTSHRLVETPASVLVFEDLKLRNMTRSAAGTVEEPGANVAAKSGLNRSLLHQGLGRILQFTKYKAARAGKLVITVPPQNTSRRCPVCRHTEKANRHGIHFHCQNPLCGHTAHADANASENIKQDGLQALLTALGRGADQPFAEATQGVNLTVYPAGADEASRSPHLAAAAAR